MKRFVVKFLADRSGSTAIEYALIAAGIALVIRAARVADWQVRGRLPLTGGVLIANWVRRNCREEMVGVLLPPTVAGSLVNIGATLAGRVPVNLNFTAGREGMSAAVAHGSLSVTITERNDVSQPNSFSNGTTATVTPRSTIDVTQADARMFVFQAGVNLDEIVRAVNQVGAAPSDLVAILEALKQAGALRAELVVI